MKQIPISEFRKNLRDYVMGDEAFQITNWGIVLCTVYPQNSPIMAVVEKLEAHAPKEINPDAQNGRSRKSNGESGDNGHLEK